MGSHGSGRGSRTSRGWSVFDGVKPFPPTPTPESLMADIDAAIASSEHAHSTALLSSNASSSSSADDKKNLHSETITNTSAYDARLADEAYKTACAALAAGRPDAAVRSLRIALASCPPDKTSALSKLRSLLSIADSQQKQRQQQLST